MSRVARKDCPTCAALERADAEGKLDIYVDDGQENPGFPPEAESLEAVGMDGNQELRRCRDCWTLYRYSFRYESGGSTSQSYDEYHLARIEDAASAVVAPLFEPLAPEALDAALATALRSGIPWAQTMAVVAFQSAADKGASFDAALRAAAKGLADRGSDVCVACYNALHAYRKKRGPAGARAVHAALAGLDEDMYGVRWLASVGKEERNATALAAQTIPWEQRGELLHTLEGHTSAVTAVAFSPDGQVLASASYDNTIKLWDVATGKPIKDLVGHEGFVWALAFSADGKILATGSDDKTVRLWELASGKVARILSGHTGPVEAVAFSPDGGVLATAGDYATIRLWDVATSREIKALAGHSSQVKSASFSPDGKVLASASDDGTVRLWDVATGRAIWAPEPDYRRRLKSVSFNPDGSTLAAASSDATIQFWDVASGRLIGALTGHQSEVNSISFSPDGMTLASGSDDNHVKLWDLGSGEEVKTLSGLRIRVPSVVFSPDGRLLAGSWHRTIKLWDLQNTKGKEESHVSYGVPEPADEDEDEVAAAERAPSSEPIPPPPAEPISPPPAEPIPPPPVLIKAWSFESSLSLEDIKEALDGNSSSPWQIGESPRRGRSIGHFVAPDSTARIYSSGRGYVVHLESKRVDYPMLFASAETRLLSEILPWARAENVLACEPLGPE